MGKKLVEISTEFKGKKGECGIRTISLMVGSLEFQVPPWPLQVHHISQVSQALGPRFLVCVIWGL